MKAVLATLFAGLLFVACTKKEEPPAATAPAVAPIQSATPTPEAAPAAGAPQTEPAPTGK